MAMEMLEALDDQQQRSSLNAQPLLRWRERPPGDALLWEPALRCASASGSLGGDRNAVGKRGG